MLLEESGHPDDDETEWRQKIDTVMSWFSEEDFHLVTLYYGEPDNVGHAKGPAGHAGPERDHPSDRPHHRLLEGRYRSPQPDRRAECHHHL